MSTTFGDLFLSHYNGPYELVAIGVTTALAGMFSHWLKLKYKDQDPTQLFQYFFVNNRKSTFIAVMSMLGALATAFGPLDYTQITVYQVITQAFAIGYASDSLFNNTSDGDHSGEPDGGEKHELKQEVKELKTALNDATGSPEPIK